MEVIVREEKMSYPRKIIVIIAAIITILVGGITIIDRIRIWKERTSPPPVVEVKTTPESHDKIGINKESPEKSEKEKRLDEFRFLINETVATSPDKQDVTMIIESSKTEHGFSPENLLYNLLKTERVNIIINFFKEEAFKSKSFFKEIYDGNTELLKKADVYSKIDCIILGRIDYSFRKTGLIDEDLISCDITFSYKVINKNAQVVEINSISVTGSGFSEDRALKGGLEILCEEYSDEIISSIL